MKRVLYCTVFPLPLFVLFARSAGRLDSGSMITFNAFVIVVPLFWLCFHPPQTDSLVGFVLFTFSSQSRVYICAWEKSIKMESSLWFFFSYLITDGREKQRQFVSGWRPSERWAPIGRSSTTWTMSAMAPSRSAHRNLTADRLAKMELVSDQQQQQHNQNETNSTATSSPATRFQTSSSSGQPQQPQSPFRFGAPDSRASYSERRLMNHSSSVRSTTAHNHPLGGQQQQQQQPQPWGSGQHGLAALSRSNGSLAPAEAKETIGSGSSNKPRSRTQVSEFSNVIFSFDVVCGKEGSKEGRKLDKCKTELTESGRLIFLCEVMRVMRSTYQTHWIDDD